MRICGVQVELRPARAVEPLFRYGPGLIHRHLCMASSNTSYYESLVLSNPIVREECVDEHGLIHAPETSGLGFELLWQQQGHSALAEQI